MDCRDSENISNIKINRSYRNTGTAKTEPQYKGGLEYINLQKLLKKNILKFFIPTASVGKISIWLQPRNVRLGWGGVSIRLGLGVKFLEMKKHYT